MNRFITKQAVEHDPLARLVFDTESNRCLGGAGCNFYRCWVFPLYTPGGITVIQEFPFDHPFHNGFFVGQNPVLVGGREANFWAAPPRRAFDDAIYRNLGRVSMNTPVTELHENGVRLTFTGVWRDENEEPILDEVRTINFQAREGATICDMTSRKIASYGAIECPQTKYGSIGVRVEPRLLPPTGGAILADRNRRGDASVLDETGSDYVAYENSVGDKQCGIFLTVPDGKTRGPWFVRDYGMAMLNATQNQSLTTPQGKDWTITLRVVAYDGSLDDKRAAAWRAPDSTP